MNLPVVERYRTPCTTDALRDALHQAHHDSFGFCSGDDVLSNAWSMCAFEHGLHRLTREQISRPGFVLREHGSETADLAAREISSLRPGEPLWFVRGIWRENVGNHDGAAPGAIGILATIPEREVIAGAEVERTHHRAAFASLTDGCAAYWRRLAAAWPNGLHAMQGTPVALARALKHEPLPGGREKAYYTDDERAYAIGLASMRRRYLDLFRFLDVRETCGWI